jgi:hypothetical protein
MATGASSEIGLVTAQVLAQRFVQRWDLHAHQLDDGSYVCVHEQLDVGHLFAHLRGEITLGTHLLDQDSQRARLCSICRLDKLGNRPIILCNISSSGVLMVDFRALVIILSDLLLTLTLIVVGEEP